MPTEPTARPLLATADDALLEELLTVCSLAGIEPEVARDVVALRRSWGRAPVVLVGADLARLLGPGGPPGRRDGVVLVSTDLDDAQVWQLAVQVGAERVAMLPDSASWLGDRLAEAADGGRPAAVVSVVGGRGGAGASCLAAALASTACRAGLSTVLVDVDPLGGGIDLLLGAEDVEGLRWPDLAHARGRVAPRALRDALPSVAGIRFVSWDRGRRLQLPAEPVRAVLGTARRACDLVVADVPRSVDEAAEAVLRCSDVVLLVVPAEVRATVAASRVAAVVGAMVDDLRLVVRGPAPGGLGPETIAASLGLALEAWLPAEPGLAEALERGDRPAAGGRGPLARFSRALLDELGGPRTAAA